MRHPWRQCRCQIKPPTAGQTAGSEAGALVIHFLLNKRCTISYKMCPEAISQYRLKFKVKFIYWFIWGFTSLSTLYRSYITTGSWEGRGNQYLQLVKVLYCKLPTNSKQLPAFPLEVRLGTEPQSKRWEARVLPLCHRGPLNSSPINKTLLSTLNLPSTLVTKVYKIAHTHLNCSYLLKRLTLNDCGCGFFSGVLACGVSGKWQKKNKENPSYIHTQKTPYNLHSRVRESRSVIWLFSGLELPEIKKLSSVLFYCVLTLFSH